MPYEIFLGIWSHVLSCVLQDKSYPISPIVSARDVGPYIIWKKIRKFPSLSFVVHEKLCLIVLQASARDYKIILEKYPECLHFFNIDRNMM